MSKVVVRYIYTVVRKMYITGASYYRQDIQVV